MLRNAYRNRLSFGPQTVVSFQGGCTLARVGYSTVSGAGAGAGAGPAMSTAPPAPNTPSKAPDPPASDTPNKNPEPDPNTPTKTLDGNNAGHGDGRRGSHREGRTVRSRDTNGISKGDWWNNARNVLLLLASLGGVTATVIAGDIGYAQWRENQRQRKIYAAFQPTAVPIPPNFVERPVISEMIRDRLTKRTRYEVIVGNSGTGKSTIVKKVASTIPGAIYIHPAMGGNVAATLADAFAAALNWEEQGLSWREAYSNDIIGNDHGRMLERMLEDFEHLAAKFQAEYGHPAVLVFDNINAIADKDPELLYKLQSYAKEAADKGSYKVVFVCSGGVAPAQMKTNSAWSRGPKGSECRIGDLTHAEAMEYLTVKRKIDSHEAMKIVDFCGPRILLLKDACDELETETDLDSYIADLKEGAWDRFIGAAEQIDENRALAVVQRIIQHGPINYSEYRKLCGNGGADLLSLYRNVFVNIAGKYDFENKVIAHAVRERLG